jgi:hypothetical protein
MTNLAEWFDFGEDKLGLYPFKARCVAAKFNPMELPYLLELGRLTIEFVIGMSRHPSRQIKAGKVVLYFPERWLTPKQKQALMQSLVDVHETYPLTEVCIVTAEPLIISDFTDDMVRIIELKKENQ